MDIKWVHNYLSVEEISGINVIKISAKISSLNIDSVSDHHRGNFTCIARNAAGTSKYSAVLNVNGIFIYGFFYFIANSLLCMYFLSFGY